ncbi:MAG: hypothetical protein L6R40_007298 [Gallowayella cf. fulva]|nr:MAG: hypothetical protein L6R40_007298 [Xanthomendoza cf. fulva]
MSIPRFASISSRSHPGRALDVLNRKNQAKRKRDDGSPDRSSHHYSPPVSPPFPALVPLDSSLAEQHRTAGQSCHQSPPPFPFPHASFKEHSRAGSRRQDDETSLDPNSDFTEGTPGESDDENIEAEAMPKLSSSTRLRQQHYTVLTSVLHRCLLEQDYVRASRAWGMLLRLEVNGQPFDIRSQERWGIGAELLLRGDGRPRAPLVEVPHLSVDRLMRAKDYYERLILQYPYRKTSPDSTSALTFYPVMFGVWIYSIQLRYKSSVQDTLPNSQDRGGKGSNTTLDHDLGDSDSDSRNGVPQTNVQVAARRTAFQQANDVIGRLSELLVSPPYSDHSGLWKILGMLYLWLHHHSTQSPTSPPSFSSREDEPISPTLSLTSSDSKIGSSKRVRSENDPGDGQQKRQQGLLNAKEAFHRALKLGGTIDSQTQREVGL